MVPIFLIGGLLLAGPLLYTTDRTLSQVFVTPVAPVSSNPGNPAATPLPLPDWNKKERVNILLLGLDKRPDETYGRTDTIIVVSIDPVTKSVGLMSLPRDLRVSIPGHGLDKINAAYVYGDVEHYPGGGVGLLKQTIYQNFGLNMHYFAQVDFNGFVKVVDTFGGVNVDVPYPIKDNAYPTETNGYVGIYFPAGWQHLNGTQALRYARTRHADNDFGREARQQQVILSLRQQALSRDLPSKFFQLLDILGASVRTDLSVQQAAALAKLGQGIPRENIKSFSIHDLVRDYTDPSTGIYYLLADWPQVRQRVREMVPNAGTVTAAAVPDPGLHIAVQNASQVNLFASHTVERLKSAGFSGAVVDPTAVAPLANSVVYDYTGKGEMAFLVARMLGLPQSAVKDGSAAGPAPPGVDVLVVLGEDAPMLVPRTPVTPVRRN